MVSEAENIGTRQCNFAKVRQVRDVRCFGGTPPGVPLNGACASTGVGLCDWGGLGSPNGIRNALDQVIVSDRIGNM
jgi:hypothetical protein